MKVIGSSLRLGAKADGLRTADEAMDERLERFRRVLAVGCDLRLVPRVLQSPLKYDPVSNNSMDYGLEMTRTHDLLRCLKQYNMPTLLVVTQ